MCLSLIFQKSILEILRSGLTFKHRADLDIFESVFVEVIDKGKTYIAGVVYRPPDSDIAVFHEKMGALLDNVKDRRCYLLGDFNLDLLKSEHHSATGTFISDLNSKGLHPLISLPTRITGSSATLIDNIFTNDYLRPVSSGLLTTSISDHLPFFALFGEPAVGCKGPRYTWKRDLRVRHKERFREWVNDWGQRVNFGVDSIEEDVNQFRNELRDGYNNCFPLKRIKVRKLDIEKPWLNDATLLSKIKERNRLYALQITGELTPPGISDLRRLTNEVTRLRRDLKRSYFARRLDEAGKNSGDP